MMMPEDALIEKSRLGDQRAFRGLYEHHVDALYRFLKQFSRDRHEVEDWVQRAFAKAFLHLGSFQGQSRFSTWLFSIGLNEMRSDRRRSNIIPFEPIDQHPEDSAIEEFDWNELMKTWLSQLDETKRAVFLLYEVEGYSHAEIGDMLAIQESTSRTILTRTKQWLRERWEQERRATA